MKKILSLIVILLISLSMVSAIYDPEAELVDGDENAPRLMAAKLDAMPEDADKLPAKDENGENLPPKAEMLRATMGNNTGAKLMLAKQLKERINAISANLDGEDKARFENFVEKAKPVVAQKIKNLDAEKAKKLASLSEDDMEKLSKLTRSGVEGMLKKYTPDELNSSIVREKIESQLREREELKNNDFKARMIGQDQLNKAKENYQSAKEKYSQAKERYMKTKQIVNNNRERIKACFADETSYDDCAEKINSSKEYLIDTTDSLISSLEKILAKVEESESVDEELAIKLIEEINAKIDLMNEAKTKFESAESADEIKEATVMIKEAWPGVKNSLKRISGVLLNRKMGGMVVRLENLEERLESILTRLEEDGQDIAELDSMITEFSNAVAVARENYELAKEKWAEAENAQDVDEIIKSGNEYIKESQAKLKLANDKIKEILKSIKEANADVIDEVELVVDASNEE